MTLDQLRVFVAVADEMHVTRAAVKLNMTQSAASAAIAALENRCGLKLFDRVGRNISLTADGAEFLLEAKAVVARADQAEQALNEIAGLRRGRLRIFASQTIAAYWLPPLCHRYRELYPDIALSMTIGNSARVIAAVAEAEADIGFVETPVSDARFDCVAVAEDDLVLVVASDHPWARKKPPLPAAELRAAAWVLREEGSGTRQVFEEAVKAFGVRPADLRKALVLPSNEAIRTAVEAGAGATIFSRLVAASSLKAGTLKAIDVPLPRRHFFAIRHRDRSESRAEAALLALATGGGKSRSAKK